MEPKVGNPVLPLIPSSARWMARPSAISVAILGIRLRWRLAI
jgi:hypothetical protein